MKLRLKSHTVCYRISHDDFEILKSTGQISCVTTIPTCQSKISRFRYEIQRSPEAPTSDLFVSEEGFSLVLCEKDWLELADEDKQAVYIRREWKDANERMQRSVIYVEKDKGKKHKEKKHQDKHKHKDIHKHRLRALGGFAEGSTQVPDEPSAETDNV